MVKLGIQIDRWDFDDAVSRAHEKTMKIIGEEVMSEFAGGPMLERFTSRNEQQELQFAKRDATYTEQKRFIFKRGGRTLAHVWRGDTEKAFQRNSRVRVTAKLWRVVVTGLGPQYKRAKKGRINLLREIQRMNPEDVDAIKRHIESRYIEVLTSPGMIKRRRQKF